MINSDHAVRRCGVWMTDLRLAGACTATRNTAPDRVVDSNRIKDLSVLMTMVGGHVEHCAPGHEMLCPES